MGGICYRTLSSYLLECFGEKLIKLSLDGGMTCPNRDGTAGRGGCIFCLGGSGAFAQRQCGDIGEQIERAKALVAHKSRSERYIAYFQSYTNTYAPIDYLERLYGEVISRPDIAVLDIATRPDCLGDDVLALIARLGRIKPVWVELGLQTAKEQTARLINRGYPLADYDRAVPRLHEAGVQVITHVIIGLPGESVEDAEQTVRHVVASGADGIKLQLLHVLRGTPLERMYHAGEVPVMTLEQYAGAVARLCALLPPEMVVHRLTGDGARQDLIAPLWSLDKKRVLGAISKAIKEYERTEG